ncbi:MAG TPA: metallophosphoesterase [Isosphaeraceae bacterium]|jgi:hypothetical protein|nr:metallophosphoesterase [Isosphaeraceae bacterium]
MPFHLTPRPEVATSTPTPRLSRRDFLAGMAIGGTGIMVGCSRRAGSDGNEGGWYAWLADTHVAADPRATLRDEVMAENLKRVVDDILEADDPPHGVVVDGDLAYHDGQPKDYDTFLATTAPLRAAGIPMHLALGNHDDRSHVRSALKALLPADPLDEKLVGVVEGKGLRMLLLDSLQKPNVTPGRLGRRQLGWLAGELDAHPEAPAIVFVHHNLNASWQSALLDTDDLLGVLVPRRQAKAVVFGHTHVWNPRQLDGLHAINLPAVGYRFLPKQPLGWCVFRPTDCGGELELRCVGGDRRQHGRRVPLTWRST